MTKIEELKQALAAATPGTWHYDQDFGEIKSDSPVNQNCAICRMGHNLRSPKADAAIVVAAHNALPTLLAIAETLMQYPTHPMMNVRQDGAPSLTDLLEKLK